MQERRFPVVNINVPIEDERHADLNFIQEEYSKQRGVKLSKAQTIKILFFETANALRKDGTTKGESVSA
jgi:hypothetical protein